MSLLMLHVVTSCRDLLAIKRYETFLRNILYCPIIGKKLIRNVLDAKRRAPNIIQTFSNSLNVWMSMSHAFAEEEILLAQDCL